MNLALIADWKKGEWMGFTCYTGVVDGRECCIVVPPNGGLPDARWVWKAEFLDAFPAFDLEMLNRGYFLTYMNVQNMYGAPVAMKHFDEFYTFAMKLGLNKKTVMEGMSRGGLFVYNWACDNTEKIACLYADAPVCDIRSWPVNSAHGQAEHSGERCLNAYGLTKDELDGKYTSPIDKVDIIARAGIPVIHVCGDADDVVPIQENSIPLLTRYIQAGGLDCRLIVKPGCGHHPHGLEDPVPVAEFIERSFRGIPR